MKEFQLIHRLSRRITKRSADLKVGIGDDCSVISAGKKEILITCDSLLEGVHFKSHWAPFDKWGEKIAGAALSDIAAMGGTPKFCWVELSLPKKFPQRKVDLFYRGLEKVFRKFKTTIAGGNITRSPRGFCATLMIWGERPHGIKMLRSDAKVGDLVFLAGPVGDAAKGLNLLQKNKRGPKKYLKAFLQPQPQIATGQWLAKKKLANACIDISDSLLQDLHHVATASKVKIIIETKFIPKKDGEDYSLAFTAPPHKRIEILKKKGIVQIGKVVKGINRLPKPSWDHFA
ncbi:MAG: thiamine-phosphate kinase [Deltaproteobacteria bacterium]|nr:thiamine-phosphate kinase [Deltaproteobacteria bacterium]